MTHLGFCLGDEEVDLEEISKLFPNLITLVIKGKGIRNVDRGLANFYHSEIKYLDIYQEFNQGWCKFFHAKNKHLSGFSLDYTPIIVDWHACQKMIDLVLIEQRKAKKVAFLHCCEHNKPLRMVVRYLRSDICKF